MRLVLVFSITQSVLFSLIGGETVDCVSRLGLMLASDAARGVLAIVVAGLGFVWRLEVRRVFNTSLIFGFVDALYQPAYATVYSQIVPLVDLPNADSLTSMSINLGRVAGRAVGATQVGAIRPAAIFAVNGLSFVLWSALSTPPLSAALARPASNARTMQPCRDLRQACTTVLSVPWLWMRILVSGLTNSTLAGPYAVAMHFLSNESMKAAMGRPGMLYAVFPPGGVIGGVWRWRRAHLRRRGLLMQGGEGPGRPGCSACSAWCPRFGFRRLRPWSTARRRRPGT